MSEEAQSAVRADALESAPPSAGALAARELAARVEWLIRLRWLGALSVGAGGAAVAYFLSAPGESWHLGMAVGLALVVAGYNVILLHSWRRIADDPETPASGARAAVFANVQIGLDLAVLTGFVALTGGYASPFVGYYVFHMAFASMLLSQRAAYGWAPVSFLLGGAVILLSGPPGHFTFGPEGVSVSSLRLMGVGALAMLLYFSVYVVSSLALRLRSSEREAQRLLHEVRSKADLLADAYDSLQATQILQTTYMRRVSHELRSPLGAISSSLQAVADGYAGDISPTAQDLLSRARGRIEGLLQVVNDLLALSRSRTARPREYLESVSVQAITAEVVALLSDQAHEARIAIVNEVPDTLPPILADREDVSQLVTNLVSNAIKYNRPDGTVTIRGTHDRTHIELRVSDTGIGIAEGDLPHLYDEFFRATRGKEHCAVGTGLGLSIVRAVVRQLDGDISVRSEEGVGTTFTVRLPAMVERSAEWAVGLAESDVAKSRG